MKDKFLIFLIGALLGAIITASCFLIYEKTNSTNQVVNEGNFQMMERPSGEMPPEKPNGMENDEGRPEFPINKDDFTNNETN